MVEPHVSLDPASLSPIEEKLQGALEDQLTSAMQAATDKVADDYAGEPVDDVAGEVLARTKDGLHPDIAAGLVPDQRELRRVAEAIVHES
ncbi:MAG: hypothetical protein QOE51_2700 [Actinoplanes sp.]|jgi:hypothetical protein|nr:hypothetical protein [Actinoplanes sp.]